MTGKLIGLLTLLLLLLFLGKQLSDWLNNRPRKRVSGKACDFSRNMAETLTTLVLSTLDF